MSGLGAGSGDADLVDRLGRWRVRLTGITQQPPRGGALSNRAVRALLLKGATAGRFVAAPSHVLSLRPGATIRAERHLTVRRQAAAPHDSVWAVCADFPNLAAHWDGLKASRPIGDQTRGVGARRQVDLKPLGALVETVTAWEQGRTLATTNQPSALVPFKQAKARLTLEPHGDRTAITFDYRYVPRGGPMGRLTGPVIDKILRRDFESMLAAIEEAARNAG